MPYFLDDLIKKISMLCIISQNDPYAARAGILDIKNKENPRDEEVRYLMEKMIFVALDSPKKFQQLGSLLVTKMMEKEKSARKDVKRKK